MCAPGDGKDWDLIIMRKLKLSSRWGFLMLGGVMLAHLVSARSSAQGVVLGDFRPAPTATLYIVKESPESQVVELLLDVKKGSRSLGDRVMVRAYDPDEKQFFREYFEFGQLAGDNGIGDDEAGNVEQEGVEKQALPAGTKTKTLKLSLDVPGVYQVRLMAGRTNSIIRVRASERLKFGVSYQVGEFTPWSKKKSFWAYVPPRSEQLTVRGQWIQITDDTGAVICDLDGDSARNDQVLKVSRSEVLWKFDFKSLTRSEFRASGFPLILCADQETANKIKASIEVLPDGTIVAHKFQREIYRLVREMLSEEDIGEAEALVPTLSDKHIEVMLRDPERFYRLFNNRAHLFQQIDHVIRQQNVDPNSHWAGALVGWKKFAEQDAPNNRWDRYVNVKGLANGISGSYNTLAAEMVWLATHKADWNPYYGKKQLIQRAIIAALADLLRLGESERFPDASSSSYAGGLAAFYTARKTLPIYAAAAQYASEEVRSVWTEALMHVVDRSFPDSLVTARNQSSHYLLLFDDFARGSMLPEYRELASQFAERFVSGASDAGYHMESCGPDASYIGITHWHMAEYILQARPYDPESADAVLKSLENSIAFFMHTVAPEPDGMVKGGNNFNHRTSAGHHCLQWSGSQNLMYDEIPHDALWRNNPRYSRKWHADQLRQKIEKPKPVGYLGMQSNVARFREFNKPSLQNGVWPATEKGRYIREFGNELIAVRRPSYFASIYVGKPAQKWYIRKRDKLRKAYPNNAESEGGQIKGLRHPYQTPLLGGGLTLLSSEDYGTAIYATNWSPLTYHGPVVIAEDKTRSWADYHTTTYVLNELDQTLTVQGSIEGYPLNYQRKYVFKDDALEVEFKITASKSVSLHACFENIPILLGSVKARGAAVKTQGDSEATRRVTLRDEREAGFDIVFDEPYRVEIEENGLYEKSGGVRVQVGRVEVSLPNKFNQGDSATVRYRIVPVK